MPLGIGEILIIGTAFVLAGLFGRGFIKQLLRNVFGAKQDLEEIKKEFEPKTTNTKK